MHLFAPTKQHTPAHAHTCAWIHTPSFIIFISTGGALGSLRINDLFVHFCFDGCFVIYIWSDWSLPLCYSLSGCNTRRWEILLYQAGTYLILLLCSMYILYIYAWVCCVVCMQQRGCGCICVCVCVSVGVIEKEKLFCGSWITCLCILWWTGVLRELIVMADLLCSGWTSKTERFTDNKDDLIFMEADAYLWSVH